MRKKTKDTNELDIHAEKRDKKLRKEHHLTDNRKSIQLITRLSSTPRHRKKSSPR